MDFLSALSDDQKALLGCVVAISCTSLLLIISNFIGKSRSNANNNNSSTIPLKRVQAKEASGIDAA